VLVIEARYNNDKVIIDAMDHISEIQVDIDKGKKIK
jgi:hypothetical protein